MHGQYDAKAEGFLPGGGARAQLRVRTDPITATFERATKRSSSRKLEDTGIMFKSRFATRLTRHALESADEVRLFRGLSRD